MTYDRHTTDIQEFLLGFLKEFLLGLLPSEVPTGVLSGISPEVPSGTPQRYSSFSSISFWNFFGSWFESSPICIFLMDIPQDFFLKIPPGVFKEFLQKLLWNSSWNYLRSLLSNSQRSSWRNSSNILLRYSSCRFVNNTPRVPAGFLLIVPSEILFPSGTLFWRYFKRH